MGAASAGMQSCCPDMIRPCDTAAGGLLVYSHLTLPFVLRRTAHSGAKCTPARFGGCSDGGRPAADLGSEGKVSASTNVQNNHTSHKGVVWVQLCLRCFKALRAYELLLVLHPAVILVLAVRNNIIITTTTTSIAVAMHHRPCTTTMCDHRCHGPHHQHAQCQHHITAMAWHYVSTKRPPTATTTTGGQILLKLNALKSLSLSQSTDET